MTWEAIEMIADMGIQEALKKVIRQTYRDMNVGKVSTEAGESLVNSLCDIYGTEYVARLFVEMTKNGEL